MPSSSDETNPDRRESMDLRPSVPRRRGSNDNLSSLAHERQEYFLGFVEEQDNLKKSTPSKCGDDNDVLTGLAAHLLSRLSAEIASKLSIDEWNQVCREVAQFPATRKQFNLGGGRQDNETVDNESVADCASVVSVLTGFTGFSNKEASSDEKEKDDQDEQDTNWQPLM